MNQSTMMALFELEDKENEQIQSFSETPAPAVKPKEVTEAEDQIKDEEKDDEDDDKEYREQHNDDDNTTDDTSDLGTDTGTDESTVTEDVDKDTGDTSTEDDDTASVAADLHATDEDDDKDKSKIATAFYRMSVYDILHTRMIKFEYGTQAGTPDPGCAGCSPGTADAADAAIIDSEVEPAEPTVDNTDNGSSDTGGDLGGGDLGGGDDLGGDLGGDLGSSFYAKMMSPYDTKPKWYEFGLEEYVPTFNDPETANYGLSGFLKDIVSVVGDTVEGAVPIVKKCANYLSVAGKRAAKGMMTTKSLAKFYRWKFKKYLSYVDEEKLKSMKVDALPAKNWVGMSKGCIEISKAISSVNVDKVSGDDFKKIITVLTAKFKLIGVNMTATDDRAKFEGFNKARKGGTVYELGYTPDVISNYFQELEYLGEIVSPARTKQFAAMFGELGNTIKKVVSKNKKAVEVYSARFSYITKCRETLLTVCDELIDELKHIASAYEVCMDTDRGDQETDKADGVEK